MLSCCLHVLLNEHFINFVFNVVADKVTVKQDREFKVIAVHQEGGNRIVMIQTPNMEGNPEGTKTT